MFRDEDFLLKKSVELYNNIASIGDFQGRLKAVFEIYPTLRIAWNFESFDGIEETPTIGDGGLIEDSIMGHQFKLEKSAGTLGGIPWGVDLYQGYQIEGTSANAWIGNTKLRSNLIDFYLPNAKFLAECHGGSLHTDKYDISYPIGEQPLLENVLPTKSSIGGRWECPLGNDWTLSLRITDNAKEWLKARNSHGTYLVGIGTLKNDGTDTTNDNELSLNEACAYIEKLCWMLSFANGGYLGPAVMLSRKFGEKSFQETALFGAYQTTPLELVGHTWLMPNSDLCNYISCFQTFERMINQKSWNETFELILIWYLQAIQPTTSQGLSKPWPVIANALGAALERLSFTILEQEFDEDFGDKSKKRIRNLLEKIGIVDTDEDDDRFVDIFVDTRNNATHVLPSNKFTEDEMMLSLQYAKSWVEEALLWRLGYEGAYRRRVPGSHDFAFEEPRYNIKTRKMNW